jgi:apolipoprotein N-acyltransferase
MTKRQRETGAEGESKTTAKFLTGLSNMAQTCIVCLLAWVLFSVNGMQQNIVRLEEQVKELQLTIQLVQTSVAQAGDDRYRRSDAERDFSRRDAHMDDLQAQINRKRDK